MSTARPLTHSEGDHPTPNPLAGFLSYLVPGLGQIVQGRIGKGVLFFVCLYALFFYGLYLGRGQNVYIQPLNQSAAQNDTLTILRERASFIGQFWIGVAAWPAILQYVAFNPSQDSHPQLGTFQRMPSEQEQIVLLQNSDKSPDLGWTYTVIAGVLNILVIYDAFAGAAFGKREPSPRDRPEDPPSSPEDMHT
jgi:hypothetical protein